MPAAQHADARYAPQQVQARVGYGGGSFRAMDVRCREVSESFDTPKSVQPRAGHGSERFYNWLPLTVFS